MMKTFSDTGISKRLNSTQRHLKYLDPHTRGELSFEPILDAPTSEVWGFWKDKNNSSSIDWPQIDGIIFLNASRGNLATIISEALRNRNWQQALAHALADADNHAAKIPDFVKTLEVAENYLANPGKSIDVRAIMRALSYGRVGEYFRLRPNTPSFFSGIGLLKKFLKSSNLVIDLCSGVGHFSSTLENSGIQGVCVDFVFSKLWISRRSGLVRSFPMITADLESGETFPFSCIDIPVSFFCHDAFYFFKNKQQVVSRMCSNLCHEGQILIGHAHLSDQNHGLVSGYPLSADQYKSLFDEDDYLLVGEDFEMANNFLDSIGSCWNYTPFQEAVFIVKSSFDDNPKHSNLGLLESELFVPSFYAVEDSNYELMIDWPDNDFSREFDLPVKNSCESLPVVPSRGPMTLNKRPDLRAMQPSTFSGISTLPLKWGIVGLGWVSKDYMIPAFRYSPYASLTAVFDTDPLVLSEYSSKSSEDTILCTSIEDMNDPSELDAIYIAAPNDQHFEIIKQATNFGISVLCEKPICNNLRDLHEAALICKKAGVRLKSAYNQRYHPAHQLLKTIIAKGELGQVTQIRIHYACWLAENWSNSSTNWRIDSIIAGGGASIDLLPHGLDLCSFLLNTVFESISVERQNLVHSYSKNDPLVDDGAIAQFKTKDGILGSVHCAYNCPDPLMRRQLEIIGTKGRAYATNTLGQEAGGHLEINTITGLKKIEFPKKETYSPFVRQLDEISRKWLGLPCDDGLDSKEFETMSMFLEALEKS